MNYIKLIVESNVNASDVVSFNSTSNKWEKSSSTNEIIGLVCSQPKENSSGLFEAYVSFNGVLEEIALNDIPAKGGPLGVSNGKVYVDEELQFSIRHILPSLEIVPEGSYCKIKL